MERTSGKKILGKMWRNAFLSVILLSLAFLGGCKREEGIDNNRFDVNMKYGYDNEIVVGNYIPFEIELTNKGEDFTGNVQLIIPNQDGNIMYQKELSLQAGATKTVSLTASVNQYIPLVNVRATNKEGTVIWKSLIQVSVQDDNADMKEIHIGILSDDYSALGYMDRQTELMQGGGITKIHELKADTFPTDATALDMLDSILISDFSTDSLSDSQINALRTWVSKGGALILGTGSTHNKTLSKLNHDFFEIETGELAKYSTSFGLVYYVENDGNNIDDPYLDADYEEFFRQDYDVNRAEYEELYLEDFFYFTGYTPEDYEDPGTWAAQEFYWYAYEMYYDVYYEELQAAKPVEEQPYVTCDVLPLSGDFVENSEFVWEGDIEGSGNTYPAICSKRSGSGTITICAVDFTKNPFNKYIGNNIFFCLALREALRACDMGFASHLNGYSYYTDTDVVGEGLLTGSSRAYVPPAAIYLLLIFGYLVTVIVLHVVMKKKGKTMRLWIIYPVMAVAMGILIYCVGFSTRLYRPAITYISIIDPSESITNKKTGVAIVTPKGKEHQISFRKEYIVHDGSYYDYYYHYSYDDGTHDYDSYTVAYISDMDETRICLPGKEALHTSNYCLETAYHTEGTVDVSRVGNGFRVTNNYGKDLEGVGVTHNLNVYYIGDLKAGESKVVTEFEKGYSVYNAAESVSRAYADENNWAYISGLLFGTLSPSYEHVTGNTAALEACRAVMSEVDNYATDTGMASGVEMHVFVYACVKNPEKGIYQQDTDYRERCAEVICYARPFSDIRVEAE